MNAEIEAGTADTRNDLEGALPIRAVSQRTGVNAVTLRAWERRHSLLAPKRTGKGHRLYSEQDVERVQDILTWLARGVAIGKVRALLDGSRLPGIGPDTSEDKKNSWTQQIRQTTEFAEQFSEAQLTRQLEQLLANYPPALLHDNWLTPLFAQLSKRNQFGAGIAHAFFWQVLQDQLARSARTAKKALLQTASKREPDVLLVGFSGAEQQCFTLLFTCALFAAGIYPQVLAADAPLTELALAEEKLAVRHGVICYSHNALALSARAAELKRARSSLRGPLWLAGGVVDLQQHELAKRSFNCLPVTCTDAIARVTELTRLDPQPEKAAGMQHVG